MISPGGRFDPPSDDRPSKDPPPHPSASGEPSASGDPSGSGEPSGSSDPASDDPSQPERPAAGRGEDRPRAAVGDAGGSSTATFPCPFCQAPISTSAKKCRYCREWVARDCSKCGTPLRGEWAARGVCVECETERATGSSVARRHGWPVTSRYDRTTAALFAMLLGGVGAHKFYMGNVGKGVLYLLFFWTGIPMIIGFIEGLVYLLMDDEEFARKHG